MSRRKGGRGKRMITMDDGDARDGALDLSIDDAQPAAANIRVIGVGGGGGNAINRMIHCGVEGVQFLAANTDCQALQKNKAPIKLQIGAKLTKGLGAGGKPEIGRSAALEDTEKVLECLDGTDMVFLTTGLDLLVIEDQVFEKQPRPGGS